MAKLKKVKEPPKRKFKENCPACAREIRVEEDHVEIVVAPNDYYHTYLDGLNQFRCVCGQLLEVK